MNDFEERLGRLSLVEPTSRYASRASALFRGAETRRSAGLAWALAACLALSLGANIYLIGYDYDQPQATEVADRAGVATQIHDVYVPGTANPPQLRIKENS